MATPGTKQLGLIFDERQLGLIEACINSQVEALYESIDEEYMMEHGEPSEEDRAKLRMSEELSQIGYDIHWALGHPEKYPARKLETPKSRAKARRLAPRGPAQRPSKRQLESNRRKRNKAKTKRRKWLNKVMVKQWPI